MLKARDIMVREFAVVKPAMAVDELARVLSGEGVSGAVVLDGDGGLLGVVTEGDLIAREQNLHLPTLVNLFGSLVYIESSGHLKEEVRRLAARRVEDIYTRDPVTVGPGITLADLASVMSERGVHFLPVMEGGKLLGVVSRREIIRAIASS
jgi:CBS domain-containing protein